MGPPSGAGEGARLSVGYTRAAPAVKQGRLPGWGPLLRCALRTAAACLVGAALLATAAQAVGPERTAPALADLRVEGTGGVHRFRVEVARTSEEKARGLMYRTELAPDAGMLFLHEEEQPVAMWMKNTLIPLDMLFLGANGRILRIAENTQPLSTALIPSDGPVRAVLELRGGTCRRLGILTGDRVVLPPDAPAR